MIFDRKVKDMDKAPCKDCTSRSVGCHSVCEKYLKFKREHDREREEAYETKQNVKIIDDYQIKSKENTIRRQRKRRR